MPEEKICKNYLNGKWAKSKNREMIEPCNPTPKEVMAKVPLSFKEEPDQAAQVAEKTCI